MPRKDPEAVRSYRRDYYARNKEKLNADNKAWRKANPDKVKASRERRKDPVKRSAYNKKYREDGRKKDSDRKSRYGLTKEQYESLLVQQDYLCAICKKPFTENHPCIDHDHSTGEIRGIIHGKCNSMLGLANDDPEILEAAAIYLRSEKWTGFLVPGTTGMNQGVVGSPIEQPNYPVSVG